MFKVKIPSENNSYTVEGSLMYCVLLWWVSIMLSPSNGGPSQLRFALGKFCFCPWHICMDHISLAFPRVTCSDHGFDSSTVHVCLLSICVLKQLVTPPSKLWGKAKPCCFLILPSFLVGLGCQPRNDYKLWDVFFIIDSHVGVFYLSPYADA